MKLQRVSASSKYRRRRVIKASRSPQDLIDAFEAKIAELEVESCNNITSSEKATADDVEANGCANCSTEFADTEEVEGCDISGSCVNGSIELDDAEKQELFEVIDKYNTSDPVSGKWSLETMDEMQAIANHFGITLDEAKDIMINYLGFDEDTLLSDTEGGSWFALKDLGGNTFTEHFANAKDASEFANKYDYELVGPVEASTDDDDWRARQEERAVEIDDYDYDLDYEDVGGGGFEEVSKDGSPILSLGEIKEYWNKNNINDPVLENYDTFEDWWSDTSSNYLREV